MITIKSVTSPAYANDSGTAINVMLDTEQYGEIPYTATADDDPYGVFERAAAGAFGPIAAVPAPNFDELKALKLAALASRRWQAETAGITVGGVAVMTDRESQGLIVGAALAATLDPGYSAAWKTAAGVFVSLTASEILAIAQGVRAHVQGCFDREAVLTDLIQAAPDAAALAAIDLDVGWP